MLFMSVIIFLLSTEQTMKFHYCLFRAPTMLPLGIFLFFKRDKCHKLHYIEPGGFNYIACQLRFSLNIHDGCKMSPLLHQCLVIFIWSSGTIDCMLFTLKNRVLLTRQGTSWVWYLSFSLITVLIKPRLLFSYAGYAS